MQKLTSFSTFVYEYMESFVFLAQRWLLAYTPLNIPFHWLLNKKNYTCVLVCVCACARVWVCVHVRTYVCVHMHAHMRVCVCVCVCVHACMCTLCSNVYNRNK